MGADALGLRVLFVDPDAGLGPALAMALVRLGATVAWSGALPPPEGLTAVHAVAAGRSGPGGLLSLPSRAYDAAVDFGARGPLGAAALARPLRGKVGLVVQLGTWRVYAGAVEPGRWLGDAVPPPALPLLESAAKRDGTALAAEDALWAARAGGGYPATVLRLAALYGPGVACAREWHVVGRLRAGRRQMAVPDGGLHLMHRLYVDNAVHAIVRTLDRPLEVDGRAFNVGDAHVPTARALCVDIAQALGQTMAAVPVPASRYAAHNPWATPAPVVLDLHQARLRLGPVAPVDHATALQRTAEWLWQLAEDEAVPRLAPYFARFAAGHDYAAEDVALREWGA